MTAPFREIGEAIATAINTYTGTKASEVNAALSWRAERTAAELSTLDVAVIRRESTSERADADAWWDTYLFDIAIRKRFDPHGTEAAELDPYEDLTAELRDFLRLQTYELADESGVRTGSCEISTPNDPEAFDTKHLFFAVLALSLTTIP